MSSGLCEGRRFRSIKKTGETLQLPVPNLRLRDRLRIKSLSQGPVLTGQSHNLKSQACPGLGFLEVALHDAGRYKQDKHSGLFLGLPPPPLHYPF